VDRHLGTAEAFDGGQVLKPDFVIIGAMKCATSTLHDQLARIDGVSMSEPKEPNFFSNEEVWAQGLDWYQGLFAAMPEQDLKGESSTHYTKLPTYPRCVERLHAFVPDAKLIYVMRDPIDRVVSQYIHEWSQRVIEDGCPIDDAIDRYPILIDYSKYAMQLEPFAAVYGFDRILPVFFERLMASPQEEFERIGEFLGISESITWLDDDAKNVSNQRQRRGPVMNAILDNKALQVLRRTLMPESLRSKIRSRWTMNQRPQLSSESVKALHSRLDPDLQRLGSLLGRNLSCVTYREAVMHGSSPEWAMVEPV
jgi:hypothetical protein